MFSKELVDAIRRVAEEQGLRMPMSKGRDLVSMVLVGRPYSAAIAALRDGKNPSIDMNDDRIAALRIQHGEIVGDLVRIIESHLGNFL